MKKPRKRKPNVTASELIENLRKDPEYLARIRVKDEEIKRRIENEAAIEAPILSELNLLGLNLNRIHELDKVQCPSKEAFMVVLKHLQLPYPDIIRWGIARLFERKEAKALWKEIKDLFELEKETKAKDGMAAALSKMADATHFDDMQSLIVNRKNGPTRIYFTNYFSRSKNLLALPILIELQNDPELEKEVRHILKRKKAI
jgi:hypothetical protein